jgi:hypothetical protein
MAFTPFQVLKNLKVTRMQVLKNKVRKFLNSCQYGGKIKNPNNNPPLFPQKKNPQYQWYQGFSAS